ncbi:MAG: crossover junction endodeoxyribonuclease RuvC [Gemmatimonadetes bacterium]|nr:crossover junction endodeoxyribonuclease RuvC [Gemmatimonadota bacterium]
MIVLGLDPGVTVTGYGLVQGGDRRPPRLLECGAIRPRGGAPLAKRLLEIYEGVNLVLDRARPDALCVEGVFLHRNVRSTVVLGHARAVAILAAALRGIPVVEYAPSEVKDALTGRGGARKAQVAFMVQRLLRLSTPPTPADAADALAIALCHLHARQRPGASQRAASPGRRGNLRRVRLR